MHRLLLSAVAALFLAVPQAEAYVVENAVKPSARLLRKQVRDVRTSNVRGRSGAKNAHDDPMRMYRNIDSGVSFSHPADWNVYDATEREPVYERGTLRYVAMPDIDIRKSERGERVRGGPLNDVLITIRTSRSDPDDPTLEEVKSNVEFRSREGNLGIRELFEASKIGVDGVDGVRYAHADSIDLSSDVTTVVLLRDKDRNIDYELRFVTARYDFRSKRKAFDMLLDSLQLGKRIETGAKSPATEQSFIHQYVEYLEDATEAIEDVLDRQELELRQFAIDRGYSFESSQSVPLRRVFFTAERTLRHVDRETAFLRRLRDAMSGPVLSDELADMARDIRRRNRDLEERFDDYFFVAIPQAHLAYEIKRFNDERRYFSNARNAYVDSMVENAQRTADRLWQLAEKALERTLTAEEHDELEDDLLERAAVAEQAMNSLY